MLGRGGGQAVYRAGLVFPETLVVLFKVGTDLRNFVLVVKTFFFAGTGLSEVCFRKKLPNREIV